MKTATKGDQLAYIIYTSGSTGRPKGVQIEHRNAVALLHWALKVFGPDELAGTLMATSMCFDLSVFELFAPLCCGGTVILAENALQLSMLSAAGQITLINTVPSVMAELLRAHSLPASVRVINLAGEALPQRLVRQLYETTSVAKVYNLYGPTEDTTYSTAALMKRECPPNPPIGRPIAHSQAYILDSALQPTPIGVAGELYLGGAGLARGYLNRADLTREKFIQNPFSQQAGSRLYRTGDLGRYLADETIEYLGRADQQVKLRDFRIELGEIEAVLSQHPAVEAAVVQVRERLGGDTYLLAYVVATAETSERDWRSFLRQRLPEYMIPSRFERLAAVPLTSNGKVDRRGLPEPEQQGASEEYVAPRDELEAQLEQIWEQVLGRQHIGILDNFFTLGGHSLLAVQLLARVRKDLKKDLPLSSFFNAQTVAEMAGLIEDAEHHGIPNQRTWMNSYE